MGHPCHAEIIPAESWQGNGRIVNVFLPTGEKVVCSDTHVIVAAADNQVSGLFNVQNGLG